MNTNLDTDNPSNIEYGFGNEVINTLQSSVFGRSLNEQDLLFLFNKAALAGMQVINQNDPEGGNVHIIDKQTGCCYIISDGRLSDKRLPYNILTVYGETESLEFQYSSLPYRGLRNVTESIYVQFKDGSEMLVDRSNYEQEWDGSNSEWALINTYRPPNGLDKVINSPASDLIPLQI